MGNLEEAFSFDAADDPWIESRELRGGPYDGEAWSWDTGIGIVIGTRCPNGRDQHVGLASYDEHGLFQGEVECRMCEQEERDG